MAITATARGTGNAQTSSTTLTFSPSGDFASGSWAVLFYSVDNSNTNGDAHTSITVTDSNGNTWTRRVSALNDPNIANNGVEAGVFTTDMAAGTLTTGSTITVTTSTAATAKAAVLWEVVPDASNTLSYVSGGAGPALLAGILPTVTTGSITSGDIVLAGAHLEYGLSSITGDSDTTNGSWSTLQGIRSGNAGAGGVYAASQYKVTTGTGTQTYDIAAVSNGADNISTWISLAQAAAGTTLTPANATLTVTGFAPTVKLGTVLTPATKSLSVTLYAPTVTIGTRLTPATKTLTVSTFAPSVTQGITANRLLGLRRKLS